MRSSLTCLFATAFLCGTAPVRADAANVLPVRGKYLLLDSRVVAGTENAALRVGSATKHPANPLFGDDRSWEQAAGNMYPNVVFDETERVYKMWYETLIWPVRAGQILWMNGITRGSLAPDLYHPQRERRGHAGMWHYLKEDTAGGNCTLLYAVSQDGILWDKPALDVYRYDGKPTNIVVLRTLGTGVFKDLYDKDPARRYKAINTSPAPGGRIFVLFSADGIRWSDPVDTKVTVAADTHNNAFWDPTINKYVIISRGWSTGAMGWNLPVSLPWNTMAGGDGIRTVIRMESEDFVNWSQPVEILRGPVDAQVHDLHVFRHEGVYLGLAGILGVGPEKRRVQTELAWSPDGKSWHRIDEGSGLIPLGENPGDYDWGCIFAASDPLVLKDEIRIYYCASPIQMAVNPKFQCLATLRPDGWAGYVPKEAAHPAVVITQPLACRGRTLRVTADIDSGGSVKVSVLGPDGRVLPGGRTLNASVTDGVGAQLSLPQGHPVQVRFEIKGAKVYALAFGQ